MTALEILRADQRASGMSVRQYEKEYGVLLSPPGSSRPMGTSADVRQHEMRMSALSEQLGHSAHCPRCAGKKRRQGYSTIGMDPPISTLSLAEAAAQCDPSK